MSPAIPTDITREKPMSMMPSATSCRTRRVLVSTVILPFLISAVSSVQCCLLPWGQISVRRF